MKRERREQEDGRKGKERGQGPVDKDGCQPSRAIWRREKGEMRERGTDEEERKGEENVCVVCVCV